MSIVYMDFKTTQAIMYCTKCDEYVVVETNETRSEYFRCSKCSTELIPVLDN
ncbi:MAG TPA: hypothetical protein VFP25_02895 [Nitrososphaeraceae archaeon]|nr:hypothetical protein [Nitrososphaeraceae archaeon]